LPVESRTIAAVRGGDQFRAWDVHAYLLAALVDAVRENTFVFVAANSKRKPKAPKPIPRPAPTTAARSPNRVNPFSATVAQYVAATHTSSENQPR
jgi:hypothetical protein